MAHNPFTPPIAPVADVVRAASPRPWQLKLALTLMGIDLVVPLSAFAMGPELASMRANFRSAALAVAAAIALTIYALIAALIIMVGRGKRWARIVYSVLMVLGLLRALRELPGFVELTAINRVSYLLSASANLAALSLLFMPATNRWFQARWTEHDALQS